MTAKTEKSSSNKVHTSSSPNTDGDRKGSQSPSSLSLADDIPVYNSRLIMVWLEYLERTYPYISIENILERAGITRFEVQDPGMWFNQKQVDSFAQEAVKATMNPQIAREAGRYIIACKSVQPVRQLTIGLLSMSTVYLLISKISEVLSRGTEVHTRRLSSNRIEIISKPKPGFGEKKYQCDNRSGCYESIGLLFTDAYAQVDHPECLHEGGRYCRYIVSWQKMPWLLWQQARNWIGLIGFLSLIALFPFCSIEIWLMTALGWSAIFGSTTYFSEKLRSQHYANTLNSQGELARENISAMDERFNNAMMVQEIGQATATLKNEVELVEAASKIMKERSEYDRALIMLSDPAGQRLCYTSGFGYDDNARQQLMKTSFRLDRPDSKGIFVKAFREKKPFLIQDMDKIIDAFSERSQKLAKNLAGKSMICVPIAYEDKVLGIIAIDNSNTERPLTQSDVSLLMGIASQLAVGIVNTRAYAQLQASEKKYRDLVENAHSIILRIAPTGRIIFFNRFAQKLFGFTESGIYGKLISEVLSPTSPGAQNWIEMLAEAALPNSDIPVVEETAYTLEGGRTIWIAWTYRPIFSAEGKLIEILCIGNDITQLKQTIEENAKLEIQLIRAQKMEALGPLAGGVAHDLNNVLAGVINYPELMLMRLPEDSPLRRYATSIQKSGERAAAIVQDLLTLARRNVVQVEVIDLNAVVAEYIGSPEFDRLRFNHPLAKVNTRLDPHISGILGSPVQLSKAVMNLVANAVEALEGKPGQVSILTEPCQLDTSVDAYERIPPGNYVRLTVVDTGCGMAADDLRRIFEPFFSRKKMGRSGTGLGMAVVWGTIKDHGGLIDIHSIPGRGTRFDIYFPPTTKVEKKVEATPVEAYRGKGEKILIVDDEEAQREIADEILTDLGYDVKTVASGEAAIEILGNEPTDLVVLDMIMASGMDGLDTYRRIVLRWPGQRAIIASGFSDNEKVRQAMKLGVGQYVKKPYNREGLGKAVRQELDRDDEPASRAP